LELLKDIAIRLSKLGILAASQGAATLLGQPALKAIFAEEPLALDALEGKCHDLQTNWALKKLSLQILLLFWGLSARHHISRAQFFDHLVQR
jgi:hypothetical protein